MSRTYTLNEARQDAERYEQQLAGSKTRHEALESAIKAAEASMRLLKLAQNPDEKIQCSQSVKTLLEKAERIKYSDDWESEIGARLHARPPTQRPRRLKVPNSTRVPSKAEQILVLKAGYLNGSKFPPWAISPESTEFDLEEDRADLFIDTSEFPLSDLQEDVLAGWERPQHALPPPTWHLSSSASMVPTRRMDLVQDASTDCSVVASLCAAIARVDRGGHPKLVSPMLHPYDHKADRPAMSRSGKYIARLNFNGCFRKVVIDDRLPVSKSSRVIHVVDRKNPGVLWPALLEKAYLKVRGGYDFPGSNSGTDLWILTGWIPEQAFLQSDEFDPDRFWKRVSSAFAFGDVIITTGTGRISEQTEKDLGLAGEHDYAVLDLRELDGQRLMLVKNPWCEGTSWRGRFTDGKRSHVRLDDVDDDNDHVECSRDLLNADEELSPGTFWMDLDNIIQHFESIYLNWNPGLFAHRQDIHFRWDLSEPEVGQSRPRGSCASLVRHPQFQVIASQGGTIWLLLCRHFRNAIPAAATEDEIQSDRYHIDITGHIALATFDSRGRRVLLSEGHLERGWFVDSPQTLLKLDNCDTEKPYTIVPLEQDLAATEQTFTLSAFSNSPLSLTQAAVRFPHTSAFSAAWTKDTAGGNAHSPTYSTNPQFTLTVPQHISHLTILLEANTDALNVHVKLVHSRGGRRIHSIQSKDIIADSTDYRRGCCVAEHRALDPGAYTLICSTFEPQQLGAFTLTVESTAPARLALLPREGAGRIRLPLPLAVVRQHETRLACPLAVHRVVSMYAVARGMDPARAASGRSLVRMQLLFGRGVASRTLTASGEGEYIDYACGVRLEDVDLAPASGEVWLVLERMSAAVRAEAEEGFRLEMFVDQIDAIRAGEWRVWEEE